MSRHHSINCIGVNNFKQKNPLPRIAFYKQWWQQGHQHRQARAKSQRKKAKKVKNTQKNLGTELAEISRKLGTQDKPAQSRP